MHEIPYLLYFKIGFWGSLVGIVIYAIQLGGARDYPRAEVRQRWEDMLRLVSNAVSAYILYQLCWAAR